MARHIKCFSIGILLFVEFVFAAPMPFISKEEIELIAKNEVKFLDFAKSKDFIGLLRRPYEKNNNLKSADVYSLNAKEKTKMDLELCRQLLAKIFGPLDEISLQVKNVEIFSTRKGPACEASIVDDKDPNTKHPERRVVLGFVNMKAFALVFHFSKKSDLSDQENIRFFWQGLK